MTPDYQLTHDDSAVPNHYGWKVPARFDTLARTYAAAREGEDDTGKEPLERLEERVSRIVRDLDEQGR